MRSICILFFILIALSVSGQEEPDTVSFNPDFKPQLAIPFMIDQAFYQKYPLSGEYNVQATIVKQFFDYDNEELDHYHFYSSPSNSFYYFSNQGYSFWQNSNPLSAGFSYHLKEAFDWKKFDVFFDGSAVMVNEYLEFDPNIPLQSEPAVIWQVGAGVGYKVSSNSTIFIKGSVGFRNYSPMGGRSMGGMHMKF